MIAGLYLISSNPSRFVHPQFEFNVMRVPQAGNNFRVQRLQVYVP